jgi:hypothetical protein
MLFVLVLLFHIANFHFKDVLTKSGIKNDNTINTVPRD